MQTPTGKLYLADAAIRLKLSYHATRDLLLRGVLRGGRDARQRLVVNAEDVERLVRERRKAQLAQSA